MTFGRKANGLCFKKRKESLDGKQISLTILDSCFSKVKLQSKVMLKVYERKFYYHCYYL